VVPPRRLRVAAIRARIEIEKAQRPGDPIIATLERRADRVARELLRQPLIS
jgi:hypothetical protein